MRFFVVQFYDSGLPDGEPFRRIEAATATGAVKQLSSEELVEKGPLRLIRAEVWPTDNPKQRWRFFTRQ